MKVRSPFPKQSKVAKPRYFNVLCRAAASDIIAGVSSRKNIKGYQ